ncbi:hypothetical protein BJ165DRAFT_1514903 [Panaeolus papilionaceus]|nr:hypothetical protein BJ165DRAFT_1514903 [Panaeolus papilionaceus]
MQLCNAFPSPIENHRARLHNKKSTPQHSTHCASDPPPAVTAKSANTQRPLPNGDNF